MRKSILLTGANGFLGGILKKGLERDYFIITLGSKSADVVADLSKTIPRIETPIDYVIHCAGKAHSVPKNIQEEKNFFDVNFDGTKRLCSALDSLEKKPKSFVFISSVSVYGKETGIGISEECELNGKSPYALSKIKAEYFLTEWCHKNNINLIILRLPLLVGDNPPGNLGKLINAIRKGRYVRLHDGSAKKSMVLATDLVELLPRIWGKQGVYNLTDGLHPTFNQIENLIANYYNKTLFIKVPHWLAKNIAVLGDLFSISFFNSEVFDKMTSDLTFDDTRAKEELGWRPRSVVEFFNFN